MCTPSREPVPVPVPVPVSLPWATQHSLCTPCPTLPWQTAAACTSRSRETHARIASCRDHCCCDRCHTTDRAVCCIPPFACLPQPNTHAFPLTVALYIHLHTDTRLLGPARPSSSTRKRRHPTVRARFKEIPTPTYLSAGARPA